MTTIYVTSPVITNDVSGPTYNPPMTLAQIKSQSAAQWHSSPELFTQFAQATVSTSSIG